MNRKTYYYILAFGFTAIFIVSILGMLSKFTSIPILSTEGLKISLAFFIIIYETICASKLYRIIVFSLFPIILIGYLFRIMHWPFGLFLFLGSLLAVLTLLFINAIKGNSNRFEKIVILAYPFSHFIFAATSIYRLPVIWWFIDFFIIGLIAMFLWVRLSRYKQ